MERKKILTDIEYDILDELYFVTSYEALQSSCELSDEELRSQLLKMVGNGLVKVYSSMEEEVEEEKINLMDEFRSYFYLASKKGLMEHNSR